MPTVTGLNFYPIKSCRRTRRTNVELDQRGIRDDRRWMIVDEEGVFVTQREKPQMAQIEPVLTEDALTVTINGDDASRVVITRDRWEGPRRRSVRVWKHNGVGIDQGDDIALMLSSHLGTDVRLVRMPDDHVRIPKRRAEGINTHVGFADGYPLLLTSEESLAELNRHISGAPVPMERFRPNIEVSGCSEAWDEDGWLEFIINGITFYGVKPCERCPITTTDQRTGERFPKEPLKTLAKIHRDENAALFGMNLIHAGPGTISVGDRVKIRVSGARPPL